MTDAIMMLRWIERMVGLLRLMRTEGREELTAEERASLGIPDDAARARLVEAIENAKVRESAGDGGG